MPDWIIGLWFLLFILLPLILWVLSGISIGNKWMGAGSDRKNGKF